MSVKIVTIRVQTKSGKHEVAETMADGTIKIKLKSPAQDGKANEELIQLLSKYFKVKKQKITILRGKTSRNKLIEIES